MQQIVWNLLTNAIKFSSDGGAIRIRIRREPTTVEISVTDGGQGITHDFLPFVFESFRQAEATTTRRQGGLGLGLSIVRHLVEAHGGSVKAESAGEGMGATFVVRLPIVAMCATPADTAACDPDRARRAHRTKRSRRCLVCPCSSWTTTTESLAIVAEYLAGQQATVLTAASALQAFDMLRRERVDVLLADIAMPEEDGYSPDQTDPRKRCRRDGDNSCGGPHLVRARRGSSARARGRLPSARGQAGRSAPSCRGDCDARA